MPMEVKKRAFVISGVIILAGTICAAALYWHLDYWKSAAGLESASNEKIWTAVSCRGRLFLQKAQGGIPDLSWTELWTLTRSRQLGFRCMEGRSLEASLQYTESVSEGDRREGARIFRERCKGCHGGDGSGGPNAPPLTRSQYKHGDSDLAIYKIVRDGIPGTAMPSAGLAPEELLQVVAGLKTLRAHSSEAYEAKPLRRTIRVSSERLEAAGTNADEWLMYSGSYNGW